MYKQILRKLIFITATALSLVAFSVVHKSYASDKEYAEDRIIVKYKDNVNIIQQQVTNIKNKTIEYTGSRIRGTNSKVLKVNSKTTVEEALEKYVDDINVEYAELDYIYHLLMEPNDKYYGSIFNDFKYILEDKTIKKNPVSRSQKEYFDKMGILQAWDYTKGSNGITVAVIDTGVIPHEDLTGRILPGYSVVPNDTNAMPYQVDRDYMMKISEDTLYGTSDCTDS